MKGSQIIYPIETTKRELEGVFLAAAKLALKGHSVSIGPKFELDYKLKSLRPSVYIGTRADETNYGLLKTLKASSCRIAIVDTEGGIMLEDQYKTRHYAKGLALTDVFFAWGHKGASLLADLKVMDPERIVISGAPWFDMNEVKSLYGATISKIQSQFPNSFFLFNSRLSFPNHKSKVIADKYASEAPEEFAYYAKQFNNLNETLKKLAADFPKETFVVRAHPSEDPSYYYEYFKGIDNIVINDQYNARAWVLASKMVLHNSCTTGLEAAMLKWPVVAYQEVKVDKYDKLLPNEASMCVYNYEDLKRKIEHYIAHPGQEYLISESQIAAIKEFFYNVNASGSDIIAERVDSLPTAEFVYRKDPEYRKIKTKMDIIYRYPALLSLLPPGMKRRIKSSKKYFMGKFQPFELQELEQMRDRLAAQDSRFRTVKIEKLKGSKFSFTLSPSK